MTLDKTITLIGNLYESDETSRVNLAQLNLNTYGLSKLFEFDGQLDGGDLTGLAGIAGIEDLTAPPTGLLRVQAFLEAGGQTREVETGDLTALVNRLGS